MKNYFMQKILIACLLSISTVGMAQEDTTETFDYSKFGDVQGVKRYCTQKVLNQTPQRIIHLGYESTGSFQMPGVPLSSMLPAMQDFSVNRVSAIRAQVNIPVVSTNKIIWQLGANYWGSNVNLEKPGTNLFAKELNNTPMTSAGINTTIFKPLNEKNFLIFQASVDANGVFKSMGDINGKSLTLSATAIYGWKTSEKNMIGTGIARTYRAGQLIHVPVLFWNKTFNDRWGMELLLPAKGHLRYNFSTSNMLQAGFELEGNQFSMRLPNSQNGTVFIQRGEFKPRIMWDKKISGFIWFNVQAGLRYNYRFDVMNQYDAKKDNQRYFTSKLGNPMFFNFSLNFVSP
jgi:hypothetical protein